MDGWMDGWTDEWLYVYVDGWMAVYSTVHRKYYVTLTDVQMRKCQPVTVSGFPLTFTS